MSNPVERLLAALRDHGHEPRKSGEGWTCRCPAHDDRSPSLSINVGDDGRAMLHCHAGCTVDAVCGAIGLRPADLFADDPSRRNGHAPRTRPSVTVTTTPRTPARNPGFGDGDARTFPTARDAVADLERRHGPRSALWTYADAAGDPAGLVVRWDTHTGKVVRPVSRKSDGSGWIVGGMPTPRPLYGLPDLLVTKPGDRVYVCEGEKASDAARASGLVATTSPHGAKSAKQADWSPLAGRDVVILPDHDDAGERYADDVARLCIAAGAKSVRVVRLVELWAGMPEGGDMADMVERCAGDADAIEKLRADVEALADAAEPDTEAEPLFNPIRVGDLIRQHPEYRPSVIDGLLREGEVANIVAAPKVGKSWTAQGLLVAVATGRTWLGFHTTAGRALLIDAELHRETLSRRLARVIDAEGIDPDSLGDRLDVLSVRGRRFTIDTLATMLADIHPGAYRVIVLDALYRFLPKDGEENSNETMTYIYNVLDDIAMRTGAAIVVVHHSSKGNQGEKRVTDVGSGAGSMSRAADTHLILREHEVEGAVVVEAVVRSFRAPDPFVVRWNDPGWVLAPDLDPADVLKKARRKGADADDAKGDAPEPVEVWTPERFAIEVVGSEMSIKADVLARAKERHELGKGQAEDLFKRAESGRHIYRHKDGGPSAPHTFSTRPPATLHDRDDVGGGEGSSDPPPPVPSAPGGVGGSARPPSPPSDPPQRGEPHPEWGSL